MKIKKGDNVIILTGKDKGKQGTVLAAMPKDERVLVEGINMGVRHQRSRRRGSQGQIITRAVPVHISNVALVDKKSGKATRVGYTIEEGKKVRVARKSGEKV
jgi:large subunit ribosomal protein L24